MTFVGFSPCGHAGFVAVDPDCYESKTADEYKNLVDSLRWYAKVGSVRLVDNEQLHSIMEGMQRCTGRECAGDSCVQSGHNPEECAREAASQEMGSLADRHASRDRA